MDYQALASELDSMFVVDQEFRAQMPETYQEYGWDSPQMKALWQKQSIIDSSNTFRLKQIIETIGAFPGKSLVGEKGAKAAFFILQHSPDSILQKFYPLVVEAGKNKELNRNYVGMFTDRYLMSQGKPQIYGSQVQSKKVTNRQGNEIEYMYVWPIADTTNIDSLRLWNGMRPLEEYLNGFGFSRWTK